MPTPLLKICYGLWCRHATGAGQHVSEEFPSIVFLTKLFGLVLSITRGPTIIVRQRIRVYVEISDFDVRAVNGAHVERSIHTSLFKNLLLAASRHQI